MKNLTSLTVVLFFLNYGGTAFSRQERSTDNSRLAIVLSDVITRKCHLTQLSSREPVLVSNESVVVKIDFDNSTLRSFWSPEVAVQYIFDASLHPLTAAVFKEYGNRFGNPEKITFFVDISPHDIPPLLIFQINKSDYMKYDNRSLSKENFFRKISVTAGGRKFEFDAGYAVTIE